MDRHKLGEGVGCGRPCGYGLQREVDMGGLEKSVADGDGDGQVVRHYEFRGGDDPCDNLYL